MLLRSFLLRVQHVNTPRTAIESALSERVRATTALQMSTRHELSLSVSRRVDAYHYVSRIALRAAAMQGAQGTAREIAHSLGRVELGGVATSSVLDDGTLTFTLTDAWLSDRVVEFARRNAAPFVRACGGDGGRAKRVLVDFASPNMAKELHVGHVRSAIIGHALANALELLGHEVLRVSHVGDFGTPIATVIAQALTLRLPWALLEPGAAPPTVAELTTLYKSGIASTDDAAFAALVNRVLAAMQLAAAGEPADGALVGAWQAVCKSSRASFGRIFDRLGVAPVERGESFYAPMLPAVVERLERADLVRETDGALIADVAGAPLVVRKRDGSFLYSTTDLAAVKHRAIDLGCEWVVYVVDASQKLHFEQIFALARAAKFFDADLTRLDHAAFGMILGDDGRKFSSRRGTGAPLEELLDAARERAIEARARVRTAAAQDLAGDSDVSSAALDDETIVERLGVSSVKFFDLMHERTKNYRFDLERMLNIRASSAVYVMYAYARAAAVLRRDGMGKDDAFASLDDAHAELRARLPTLAAQERALLVRLVQFDDVVLDVERTLMPHLLCEYACTVAEAYNSFYAACRVLDAPERRSRLLLCWATVRTLRNVLQVIGIEPLERI
jgi:arginyl-tRNA synthetase